MLYAYTRKFLNIRLSQLNVIIFFPYNRLVQKQEGFLIFSKSHRLRTFATQGSAVNMIYGYTVSRIIIYPLFVQFQRIDSWKTERTFLGITKVIGLCITPYPADLTVKCCWII